jgi:hypothetical protein
MPLVSISEAARLSKKSRKTLYQYIDTGKLSVTTSVTGKKQVDLSELTRVFGDLSVTGNNNEGGKNTHHVTREIVTETSIETRIKIAVLEAEVKLKDQILQEKDARINDLQKTLAMIEYKSKIESIPSDAPRKRWWFF